MGLLNNDRIQVTFRGICFGQRVIMSRMLVANGDFPAVNSVNTDLNLIINSVAAAGIQDWQTAYLACLPATYTLQQIRAQRIRPVRSAYAFQALVGAIGTNANPATTCNDAAGLTFRTAVAGKGQKGTVHVGPTPDAAAVAGLITAAYTALVGTLGTQLLGSFIPPGSGSLVVPVSWHRKTDTIDFWQTFIIGTTSRVQRRRTVGIGE